MKPDFPEQRLAWAREHGWSGVAERTIEPDLFSRLSWRAAGERDTPVRVLGEIRGTYGNRAAFAHDRPLPLLQSQARAHERFGRISGVSVEASLPAGYVLLARKPSFARMYPMPWAEGLAVTRRPLGTPTAVWAQPGAEDLVIGALAPILQSAAPIVTGGEGGEYLVAIGEGSVIVGETYQSGPEAALYRMGLADDVATRLEHAVRAGAAPAAN
ncbi:hypothetical protein [Microbacterium sediminis]|uniref:hypothetical protein n=1 Tax=Microbacterium sediminis TaxID=904291 RepID=UPI001072B450|nr:hypothetical protein [Microbacterium sediminis]QBR74039.1 hypothetical protein E3O41_06115 [Microbacterium sediminis]